MTPVPSGAIYRSAASAAMAVSAELGFRIRARDVWYLVQVGVIPSVESGEGFAIRSEDLRLTAARVHPQADLDGLLGRPDVLSADSIEADSAPSVGLDEAVLIVFAPGLAVSFMPDHCRPEDVQRLIALYRLRIRPPSGDMLGAELRYLPLGHSLELVSTSPPVDTQAVVRIWAEAGGPGRDPTYAESVSVPSLYGNKSRLAAFIAGVVGLYLPQGSRVMDVMCGTGVIARALSDRFVAFAADANPYAAVLSRAQGINISDTACERVLDRISRPFWKNYRDLASACQSMIDSEALFLHGHINDESLESYRRFTTTTTGPFGVTTDTRARHVLDQMVNDRTANRHRFPYCLVTAYFSNAYFGVQQSVELDSLRYAIAEAELIECERQFALAILLATAVACGSGPHFAQPPKVSTRAAMAELVEHRAKSVRREFETLARIACKRPPLANPLHVTEGDWRTTMAAFDAGTNEWSAGVYVDPPYSKLQYSRYYHVLNTLVSYDYPACVGQGRYPERTRRFSSRFEYRPTTAVSEFRSVFNACAQRRLLTFVSYSDRGFVPLEQLQALMASVFRSVHVYSKRVRHHSQGVKLRSRANVTEYVLVGGPIGR